MLYQSTRGKSNQISFANAVKLGIASDGGLFVPTEAITLSLQQINSLQTLSYKERTKFLLTYFMTDFTTDEISECVESAYSSSKFDTEQIAPLKTLNNRVSVLELWHGPTCAFKDIALQILPHFLVKSISKTGENSEVVILVATSGDTGKAALEGFKDVCGTRVIVFFPEEGVSPIQKLQMQTQEGENLAVIGVDGNFDDAQSAVKSIFADNSFNCELLKNKFVLSSANSINWGRLVPQIVYYFSAYADLISNKSIQCGEKINFVVPTGNFGNILAGYYAKKMGLPINKLICASNENHILSDFINSGIYDKNRPFHKTLSPSMDILISSNLERLLFDVTNCDSDKISLWMNNLTTKNNYQIDETSFSKIKDIFWAGFANSEETIKTIRSIYNEYNYLLDTHTAVAIDVYDKYVISTGDITKTVIISTASPFKFNGSVASAVLDKTEIENKSEFDLLKIISEKFDLEVPFSLRDLDTKPLLHSNICKIKDMKSEIVKFL